MPATIIDISSQYEDRQVKIGGGGYWKGQSFADDGTHMVYGDTGLSCYIRDPNNPARLSFENLFHRSKVVNPSDKNYDVWNGGSFGVSLCATNSNIGYFGCWTSLWKTTDKGLTIQRLNAFTPADGCGNYHNGPKFTENMIACDPSNPDVVYVATTTYTPGGGGGRIRFSNNGGTSFTEIPTASIPIPTWAPWATSIILFDRSAGTTTVGGQTRTARIAIHSQGVGFYLSTNGGQTWTAIGGPTLCKNAMFAIDGVLYANHNTSGSLTGTDFYGVWKFTGGSWVDISPGVGGGTYVVTLACDPNNAARVLGFADGGTVIQTLDRGVTPWSARTTDSTLFIGTDGAKWLLGVHPSISTGSAKFDPSGTNRVYLTTGLTVYRATIPTSIPSGNVDYIQEYNGELENLVSMDVRHYAEGHPVFVCNMDKDVKVKFPHEMHEYPDGTIMGARYRENDGLDPFGVQLGSINHGTSINASSDGRTVYAVVGSQNTFDQISRDGGRTWDFVGERPWFDAGAGDDREGAYGQVAVNHHNPLNMVRLPTAAYASLPKFTTNGGASWTLCSFTPTPPSFFNPTPPPKSYGLIRGSMHAAYYAGKQATVADPSNAGHFYCSVAGNNGVGVDEFGNPVSDDKPGLYKSTDGGANFTRIHPAAGGGYIISDNADYWHLRVRMVPGHPGHMWAVGPPDPVVKRSTDYGVTWSTVPFIRYPQDIALGKIATGASYPTIYLAAQITSDPAEAVYTTGMFRSIDEGATWQMLAETAVGTYESVVSPTLMTFVWSLDGDKGIFGRVYYACGGASGFRYMKLIDEPDATTRVRLS